MSDHIKESLVTRQRELKAELARVEKALNAYVGDKPAPKAKGRTPGGSTSGVKPSAAAADSAPIPPKALPDRIFGYVQAHGFQSVNELAESLAIPEKTMASTCSRLVREGRLSKGETSNGVAVYGAPQPSNGVHAEAP